MSDDNPNSARNKFLDNSCTDLQIKSIRKQQTALNNKVNDLIDVVNTLSKRIERLTNTVYDDGASK